MFTPQSRKKQARSIRTSAAKLTDTFNKRSKYITNPEDAALMQDLFQQALEDSAVAQKPQPPDSLQEAMSHLSNQNHALAEHSKMRDRARGRIKGSLVGSNILELARYLLSAKVELQDDYSQAIALVREQSTHARTIRVKKPTERGYNKFALGMLAHKNLQVHDALLKAALLAPCQADTESVHDYVERSREDMDALAFGLNCTGPSPRETRDLWTTKISATIDGLRAELKGKLPMTQREKRMNSKSCSWKTIRTKAGAQEQEWARTRGATPKKPKPATAAAAPAWEARLAALEQDLPKAPTNAVRPSEPPAPSWEARMSALESRAVSAEKAPSFTGPYTGLSHMAPPAGMLAVANHWPGMCSHCKVTHQTFEDCPRCLCHNCDKRGHLARACTLPCKVCRMVPTPDRITLKERHYLGCSIAEMFRAKNGLRR